jgi:glycosyltransferase involved in cell wall biosynthesis
MKSPMKSNVAVLILTHNEDIHIGRCIDYAKNFSSEIFVVDSFSTDSTVEIAKGRGASVLQNRWTNYSQQFQWGLDNAPITAEWVMRLDADEIIEADLAEEIRTKLPTLAEEITGVNIDRKHVFMGKWIRHGGRYPLQLLRIFRRGIGRIEQRWMDEHIVLSAGKTVHFQGGFVDHNLNNITFFVDKHNKYADREAVDILNQRLNLFERDVDLSADSTSKQASLKRLLKEKLYNRIPFEISTLLYFLYRLIFQLGFLDGREGIIYHFLQGYWYRFLVGSKVLEFEREIEHLSSNTEKLRVLSQITKLRLV